MIELTVKTLDSQNHSFTVDDDITVSQFKEKIADTVNIPADTQRIIYCGRVLQDESKLNDYDVNGKVVHLVQRAPPSSNQRSRPATPPPHRRHFRGPEHGNAMYFGSMAIPSSLLDPQNVVLPLSPHSLSASRLNVARRMLRRAALVLNALENPQNPEQPSQEEQQEEVTPVFEARVLVPTDPMDDVLSAVHNNLINAGAVPLGASAQPVFLQGGLTNQQEISAERNHLGVDDSGSPRARSISSTPGGVSPLATSIENLAALNNQDTAVAMDTTTEPSNTSAVQGTEASQSGADSSTATPNITENVSRTSEFAELLETMTRFQARFAPHMERYIQFMQNDPTISEENTRQTQAFINRVSEVLHFLGHAYHSLSDIIVRVRTSPPRPLLCRPVVIQHPTVVQAGIPIQVEAQINISPDSTNTSRSQTSQTSNSAVSTSQQETNAVNHDIPSPSTTTSGGNEPLASSTVLQPTVVGFPMFPGPTSMRVQTIPVEIRSLSSPRISLTLPRSNNNNNIIPNMSAMQTPASNVTSSNNAVQEQTTNSTGTATPVTGSGSSTTASSTTSSTLGGLQGTTFTIPGFHNNPNMEVFMEVTPESITIDSMETTFVGGGQANELLQNAFQGPPSDILNSIWHMAGQLVNRGAQSTQSNTSNLTSSSTSTTAPSAPPTEQIDSSTSESLSTQTTSNLGSSAATTQNSQARGNTQTNPTTSTHTRSTSRPHVHLAQHAIQGFDPYLPCNSHHVVPWRRFQSSNTRQDNASVSSSGQNSQSGGTGSDRDTGGTRIYPVNNTIMNILQGIVNSIHTIYGRQQQPQAQQQQRTSVNVAQATPPGNGVTGNATQSAGDGVGQGATAALNSLPFQLLQTFMPHLQNINLSDTTSSGPTIAELLHQFPESNISEGENLFSDLINLLSRHLTVGDLIQLTNGRLEPWMRIRSSIRNFFLVRVMNGSCSSVAIDRGVNRILSEMQPLFNHLSALPTRDDIDLVRSAQSLFRARLPNIISLATSRSPNSLRMLVDQCLITAKQFGALILRASRNGQPGVEVVLDSIVSHHTRGIPREIQQWTLMTTRTQMRQFLSNLGVPDSVLQPYIVRKIDAVTSNVVAIAQKDQQGEAMQVDDDDRDDSSGGASGSTEITSAINFGDTENDGEPLPTVVLGSETWHNDVPADWVPIIARDAQRQRRQNSQAPFSDAYLSGMPSKRRKIVTAAKPRGSLSQVISESVRRAVTATGLASVAPLEVVAQGAGSDINIQSAYRELLRSNVRAGVRDNSDFTPERFPNATSYFNGPQ